MHKVYSPQYCDLIIKDRYFLIIDNKDNRMFCTTNKKKCRLGKKEIDVSFFLDKKINSFWDIEDGKNFREISHKDFFKESAGVEEDLQYNDIIKNTNREIYSDDKTQKLSEEEITKLKEKGIKGDELIKIICESNSSMEKRTVFSQEKILKRKDKKFNHRIWVTCTNLFNIVETIFLEDNKRLNFMRMDTFSTILVHANFLNNSKILIFEDIDNILVSAFAERISHNSNLISLFDDKIKTRNLSLFNMKRRNKYNITHLDLKTLLNKEETFYSKMLQNLYTNYFDK